MPGRGIVEWPKVIDVLIRSGYDGPFMYEVTPRNDPRGSVEYMRSTTDSLLPGMRYIKVSNKPHKKSREVKIHLFTVLFAVALSATASPTERWLDPECFAENRAPMRTSFIVFPTASEAVPENDYTRSPFYRTLNGEWAFLRAERPGAEPEGFFRTGYDDSSWGVMPVPGIWELNGYGDPVYTNKPIRGTNSSR